MVFPLIRKIDIFKVSVFLNGELYIEIFFQYIKDKYNVHFLLTIYNYVPWEFKISYKNPGYPKGNNINTK